MLVIWKQCFCVYLFDIFQIAALFNCCRIIIEPTLFPFHNLLKLFNGRLNNISDDMPKPLDISPRIHQPIPHHQLIHILTHKHPTRHPIVLFRSSNTSTIHLSNCLFDMSIRLFVMEFVFVHEESFQHADHTIKWRSTHRVVEL